MAFVPRSPSYPNWGNPPWTIDFVAEATGLPTEVDFAVIGGGFSGLSAAARLRQVAPNKTTVLFEADAVGAGSSGHTGGMALAESAAGDLPRLGDVLKGYAEIQKELGIDADLTLTGAWELGRTNVLKDSPISWNDSGTLGLVKKIPGGTIDPGKMVTGLGNAAQRMGAKIYEKCRVKEIYYERPLRLDVGGRQVRAHHILITTNAESLELNQLGEDAEPVFTLALATEELSDRQLRDIGLHEHHPFYTVDLPYLWGRPLHNRQVIFGSGLVEVAHWSDLYKIKMDEGEAQSLMRLLESRVHGLHPALHNVQFINRWGGPILFKADMVPVFKRHKRSKNVLVLGAYTGHGVALSVYLGRWAADVMVGKRKLPVWKNGKDEE